MRFYGFLAVFLMFASAASAQQQSPIELRVDLTDAPRRLIHVTERLPVQPGMNSFSYPQWIPGQHLPGGPIDNLTGIVFHAGSADGPAVPWRRDLADLYSFHIAPPAGTTSVVASYDILEVPSRANTIGTKRTSSHVVMLEPSDVVLYPTGAAVRDVMVVPTIHLPQGWMAATALRTSGREGPTLYPSETTFGAVSMEQLVDSPILAGDHCRQYPLTPEIHPAHTLDVCAEKAADLELQPALLTSMSSLVRQTTLLFRSHHYEHFDFLIAASTHLEGDSLEHTQSADYVVKSLDLTDRENARFLSDLLPHEYTHSWCGKYRRPAGMATPEYHTPQQDDLLWVYEGMTQYYGHVLAARSGFVSPTDELGAIVQDIYNVDQPGRTWRPLQDTADASPILRGVDSSWANWRRSQDYYQEGSLLWLDVDVKIRQLTDGKKSLDDFAALFLGAKPSGGTGDTGPGVLAYKFDDVIRALKETAPYDWPSFWTSHLNALTPDPPTEGLKAAGYTYAEAETMVPDEAAFMTASHMAEMFHSLGIFVLPDGTIRDVWMNSPAYKAGLGPGDKLTAVDGKPYSAEALTVAVRRAKGGSDPITLTALRDDESATYRIDYHGGEKYAALKRNANPDLLTSEILRPR